MQFLLLMYANEATVEAFAAEAMTPILDRCHAFTDELEAAGALRGNNRLRPIAAARSVTKRGGAFAQTDGPFAETKEHLGGYYLIEVPTLDDAVEWAKKFPTAEFGTVEVRPVWPMDDGAGGEA
ncbi:MAG: YciI family protein [Planctomycetota bacterium]